MAESAAYRPRWRVEFQWFVGLTFGMTWAYGALWIGLGPLQVVVEHD